MSFAVYCLYGLMALSLFRLFAGPTIYDRLVSMNLVSAQIISLMSVHAVEQGRSFYLDVAMIYALLSFAETIAFVRFYRPRGRLS